MNGNKIFWVLFLTMLFVFCRCQEEEEEDDYDEVSHKVSKLRLEGAEYLQKVMSQLQNDRVQAQTMEVPNLSNLLYTQRVYELDHEPENYITPIYNISGPTPVPDIEAEIVSKVPPPISLSKEELLALYEAALTKASQLPILQAEPEPPEEFHEAPPLTGTKVKPALQGQMGSPVSGYYYYYFPITSFLKPTSKPPQPQPQPPHSQVSKTTPSPPQQVHATITMMDSPNKAMEPLFMAISGFIGMALMFFFSVLFVPKFGKIRSKNAQFKDSDDDMATFAQIILEAMTGKDCSERLACEIARVFRGIKSNNKPLRVLEIILPPNMAQQISQIRKAAGKKAKCAYIPCKMKKLKPPPQNQKHNQWKKKETPHDLWMKHFEKKKPANKKPGQRQPKPWTRKPPAKKA